MRVYHYCALTQPKPGVMSYLDGCYSMEGTDLNLDDIREKAGQQFSPPASKDEVVLLSLTLINGQ